MTSSATYNVCISETRCWCQIPDPVGCLSLECIVRTVHLVNLNTATNIFTWKRELGTVLQHILVRNAMKEGIAGKHRRYLLVGSALLLVIAKTF